MKKIYLVVLSNVEISEKNVISEPILHGLCWLAINQLIVDRFLYNFAEH